MRMCQPHWNALRKAIDDRGLGSFGAKSPEEAKRSIVTELEGRGAENDFDPLLTCNNMIWAEGLKRCGLVLMTPNEDGSERCPICEAQKQYGEWWIQGPADAMLREARQKKLVQCTACGGTGVMEGSQDAPTDSITRHDVPCPECRSDV